MNCKLLIFFRFTDPCDFQSIGEDGGRSPSKVPQGKKMIKGNTNEDVHHCHILGDRRRAEERREKKIKNQA